MSNQFANKNVSSFGDVYYNTYEPRRNGIQLVA